MQSNDEANRGHGLVSVKDAAALAGVSRQTVHNWIAHQRVKPFQTDHGSRLDIDGLHQFLSMRRAASEVGIKLDTLRQWTDDTDAYEANGSHRQQKREQDRPDRLS